MKILYLNFIDNNGGKMNTELNLNELVKKAKKNDERAFTNLIHNIEDEMYSIAKIKLYDDNDVYEAMQNTIILIYKNIKKLKNENFFKTWAIRILINECLKVIKSKKNEEERYVLFEEEITDTNYNIDKVESKNNLERLLNCLNKNEKLVITLYYCKNYTTKEISEILLESEGTIKSRISRAKTKVKKYIEEEALYEI